jgi:flagellar biosynthesis anti-sigma factor FlgM
MAKIDTNLSIPLPSILPVAKRGGSGPVGQIGATSAVKGVAHAATTSQTGRSESTFDTGKVAQLRAAVLDGSYKVDSGKIAANLIDTEKKLP